MNTKQKGQVSILVVQNLKTKKFLGICYEFGIVLENKNQDKLMSDLIDAAKGYVLTVKSNQLPNELLTKSDMLPLEYKQLFDELSLRVLHKKTTLKLSPDYEEAIQSGRATLSMACV